MKRSLFQASIMTLALLLAASWAYSSIFQHIKACRNPDLKSGKVSVHSVRILPFWVDSEKKAPEIKEALTQILQSVLKQHGCSVLRDKFSEKALDANIDLKYTVADLEKQFDTLDTIMVNQPIDVEKGRFSMGYVVNKLNPGEAADALVFVHSGIGPVVIFSYVKVAFFADIAVVDARTGNVLYYAKLSDERFDLVIKKPERLTTPVTKAFKHFPEATKTK